MSDLLTIGDVAERSGVAASALRFYEARGLIESERAGFGHRRFRRPVLRRIAFIVFAQRIGLTLEEIDAEPAKLPPDRVPDLPRLVAPVERLERPHRPADRRARAAQSGLTECIGCGCLSLDRRALSNPATVRARPAPVRATGSATRR